MSYLTMELALHGCTRQRAIAEVDCLRFSSGSADSRLVEIGPLSDVLRNASKAMHYEGFEFCCKEPKDVYDAYNFDLTYCTPNWVVNELNS